MDSSREIRPLIHQSKNPFIHQSFNLLKPDPLSADSDEGRQRLVVFQPLSRGMMFAGTPQRENELQRN
jgi:hypothetical protein